MEAKKDLNNTQRKVLEEIYCSQVTEAIKEYKESRSQERIVFVETILDNIKKSPKGKAVQNAIDKLNLSIENAMQYFKEQGVETYSLNKVEDMKITLREAYHYARHEEGINPDIKDFDEATQSTVERYEKARQEVRAKVWGMQTTYGEIEEEIKSVLQEIKVS